MKNKWLLSVCILAWTISQANCQAANFLIKNNSEKKVYIAYATVETKADSSGDLGTTFTSTYHVRGWKRIVRGGEHPIKAPENVMYLLVSTTDENGRRRFLTYSTRNGREKRYYGLMVNKAKGFYGIQHSIGWLPADSIKKLKGNSPKYAKGKIIQSNSGITGKWGEFGLGDPNLTYIWGFKKLTGSSEKTTTFYIDF